MRGISRIYKIKKIISCIDKCAQHISSNVIIKYPYGKDLIINPWQGI